MMTPWCVTCARPAQLQEAQPEHCGRCGAVVQWLRPGDDPRRLAPPPPRSRPARAHRTRPT